MVSKQVPSCYISHWDVDPHWESYILCLHGFRCYLILGPQRKWHCSVCDLEPGSPGKANYLERLSKNSNLPWAVPLGVILYGLESRKELISRWLRKSPRGFKCLNSEESCFFVFLFFFVVSLKQSGLTLNPGNKNLEIPVKANELSWAKRWEK